MAMASTWSIGCASMKTWLTCPLVVYSGRELSPVERRHLTLGPTHFLAKTRVQPQQLEALGAHHAAQSRGKPWSPLRKKPPYRIV